VRETPMKCRFRLILASVHCLDPASHRCFTDHIRRFSDLSLVENLLPNSLSITSGTRITFCDSPTIRRFCQFIIANSSSCFSFKF
ncbi:hypothetical protein HAX54_046853, partial [Datura stramonium]|nr:hypothetical protein [Datura stramonium]